MFVLPFIQLLHVPFLHYTSCTICEFKHHSDPAHVLVTPTMSIPKRSADFNLEFLTDDRLCSRCYNWLSRQVFYYNLHILISQKPSDPLLKRPSGHSKIQSTVSALKEYLDCRQMTKALPTGNLSFQFFSYVGFRLNNFNGSC